jgi:hypothetical protein
LAATAVKARAVRRTHHATVGLPLRDAMTVIARTAAAP